jgi:hypothetical protein
MASRKVKENAMAWLRDNIEAAQFKPVSSGYIFRAPSVWLFGAANHYLVTDAQKSEILPVAMTLPRWVLGLGLLWLLLCGLTSALLAWALSGIAFDVAIAMVKVLAIATGVLIPFIAARVTLHRLRPLLAGLPRADVPGSRIQ